MRNLYFLAACLEAEISIVESEGLNFVRKIEDITIVERHVVSVPSKYPKTPEINNCCVTIPCCGIAVQKLCMVVFLTYRMLSGSLVQYCCFVSSLI